MTEEYHHDDDEHDKDNSITADDIGKWFGSEAMSLLSSSSSSEAETANENTRQSSPTPIHSNVISSISTERHRGRPIKNEKEGKIQMSVYADSVRFLNLQKRVNDSSIADTLRRVIILFEGSETRMYKEHLKDLKEIGNLRSVLRKQVLKEEETCKLKAQIIEELLRKQETLNEACELKDQAIKELRSLVDECLK